MTSIIRVINPNSNTKVTDGMANALAHMQFPGGSYFDCITLNGAPLGIESQADVSKVEPMLAEIVQTDTEASAFIIGCYSDPGLALCRELTNRPVFGIAECAILTALTRGSAFGVISILANSVVRHMRHLRERLLHLHCAGDRPLGLTVAQLESENDTFSKMVQTGKILRDKDGSNVIILGCAGMASHRTALEKSLKLPVIDPTQAAANMAFGAITLET